jgi:hypothetical protein
MGAQSSWIEAIINFLSGVFAKPPPPSPLPPLDDSLKILTRRALVLVFDPIIDGTSGLRLTQSPYAQGWNHIDDLVNGYTADIEECSGGLVKYREVKRETVEGFPLRMSGQRYDAADYLKILNRQAPVNEKDLVNYQALVDEHHLVERIANDEFDEVWMFGFPYAGFAEATMVGKGAFNCNGAPLEAECRRFVIMGFNYERGGGEMLEDLGHRAEFILEQVFSKLEGDANLWARFKRYDLVASGQAEVGMMHWAPNSQQEYEWNNPRFVSSKCDDWLNFPNFQNTVRQVNCADWGKCGPPLSDIRAHHKWWLQHLPKVAGSANGILYNWWQYVIQVDSPLLDHL